MAIFDLKETAIYRSLVLNKIIFIRRADVFSKIFLLASVVLFLFFLAGVEGRFLGWSTLLFVFFLLFAEIEMFFKDYLQKPKLLINISEAAENIESINIAEYFDFRSAEIIEKTEEIGGVDSYLLLFFLLKEAKEMDFVFHRILIDKEQSVRELENMFRERGRVSESGYSECFSKTIIDAFNIARERGNERVMNEDIFVALSEHNEYLQNNLYQKGLQKKDVFELTSWQIRTKKQEDPWLYKNLIKRGRIGIEWASGYTPFLEDFSIDWTSAMKFAGFPETVGHKREAESLERVLSRSEINSAVLVGEPGAGRKSIIQKIIKRSFLGEGLPEINHRRFLELDLLAVATRAQGIEETEKILDEIFREAANAGNIILVINDFHNFIGGEQKPGVIDISGVLSSYLHIPQFRVIGVTSYLGFRQKIEQSSSVLSLLEKIEVKEATEDDTLLLLEREAVFLERKYRKLITFSAIKKTISLSARYIQNAPFPEKAMDILEETVVHVNQKRKDVVLASDVERIVSERTEIPVGEADAKEKDVLLNMEDLLHERLVNQNEAVKAVSLALRRSRADVDTRKSLIGSFLFLGPTGVGKTEMAKAIASIYFGAEKKVNRIDMSEFQSISDISRLIGSSTEDGVLASGVRDDPFSLILLDEIEKAHPDILNLFLQVLDEGHLTDGKGRKVDFQNSMLIATSNAGYQTILQAVEEKEDFAETKKKILKKLFRDSVFRPEFVNRFDEVVLFEPLSKEDLLLVAQLELDKMAKSLAKKDMEFNITEELKKKIVEISYDPVFGAREMQRAIQNNIGDSLSSAILKGDLNRGDSFTINAEDFTLQKTQ